jgi:hypothetical protein
MAVNHLLTLRLAVALTHCKEMPLASIKKRTAQSVLSSMGFGAGVADYR